MEIDPRGTRSWLGWDTGSGNPMGSSWVLPIIPLPSAESSAVPGTFYAWATKLRSALRQRYSMHVPAWVWRVYAHRVSSSVLGLCWAGENRMGPEDLPKCRVTLLLSCSVVGVPIMATLWITDKILSNLSNICVTCLGWEQREKGGFPRKVYGFHYIQISKITEKQQGNRANILPFLEKHLSCSEATGFEYRFIYMNLYIHRYI